jgi:hypothetical protein
MFMAKKKKFRHHPPRIHPEWLLEDRGANALLRGFIDVLYTPRAESLKSSYHLWSLQQDFENEVNHGNADLMRAIQRASNLKPPPPGFITKLERQTGLGANQNWAAWNWERMGRPHLRLSEELLWALIHMKLPKTLDELPHMPWARDWLAPHRGLLRLQGHEPAAWRVPHRPPHQPR